MKTVTKRDGRIEPFNICKIQDRLLRLCTRPKRFGLSPLNNVNVDFVLQKVIDQGCDEISTQNLDDLCCDVAASLNTVHFEYSLLAGRLLVSNLHKQTNFGAFSDKMKVLHSLGTLSDEFFSKILMYGDHLDKAINYLLDYDISFFGMKTLLKSYLLRGDIRYQVPETKMCRKKCKKRRDRLSEQPFTLDSGSTDSVSKMTNMSDIKGSRSTYTILNSESNNRFIESTFEKNIDLKDFHCQIDNDDQCDFNADRSKINRSCHNEGCFIEEDESSCDMHDFEPSININLLAKKFGKSDNVSEPGMMINESTDCGCQEISADQRDEFQSRLSNLELISHETMGKFIADIPITESYNDNEFSQFSSLKLHKDTMCSSPAFNELSAKKDSKTQNIKGDKNILILKDVVLERPQDLFMRVAVGIHDDLESILYTYMMLSNKLFTHATPTLFNSGTIKPQMSSCFLLDMQSDSIDGIYGTLKQCAFISKNSGGIGVSITKIRASGSRISFSGSSSGLVPMLKLFDATARYVDQGGNKRPGTIAAYLEPWHIDIYDFIDLRKNTGKEERRCRDLFLGLWVPDLFMRRVQDDGEWSLFCPNDCYFLIPENLSIKVQSLKYQLIEYIKSDLNLLKLLQRVSVDTEFLNSGSSVVHQRDVENLFEEHLLSCDSKKSRHNDKDEFKSDRNNLLNFENELGLKLDQSRDRNSAILYSASDNNLLLKQTETNKDVNLCYLSTKTLLNRALKNLESKDCLLLIYILQVAFKKLDNLQQKKKEAELYEFLRKKNEIFDFVEIENLNVNLQAKNQGNTKSHQRINNIENVSDRFSINITGKTDPFAKLSKLGAVFQDLFTCIQSLITKSPSKTVNNVQNSVETGNDFPKDTHFPKSPIFYVLDDNEITKYTKVGLHELHSEDFDRAYAILEKSHIQKRTIKAQNLWKAIIEAQIETGTPYMLYKDACNQRSNQKNLGTLKGSNLCTEILQYTSHNEIAVCNLGSIALPQFVKFYCEKENQIDLNHDETTDHSCNISNKHIRVNANDNDRVKETNRFSDSDTLAFNSNDISQETHAEYFSPTDPYTPITNMHTGNLAKNTQNISNTELNLSEFFSLKSIKPKDFLLSFRKSESRIDENNVYTGPLGQKMYFDYKSLILTSEKLAYNLNCVIDKNYYPLPEAESSNFKHRPIGIGVQGLADTFFMLNIPFESHDAFLINKRIFECIYYGAMRASIKLAKEKGSYTSFPGSPISQGILQFDYFSKNCNRTESEIYDPFFKFLSVEINEQTTKSALHNEFVRLKQYDYTLQNSKILDQHLNLNWAGIRLALKKYGARNSLLIAPMPTASTSQILGYNECIEPNTSNIYTRRTLAGEFQVVNKYLMDDLLKLGKWDINMKNYLVENEGSIQKLDLPLDIKEKYKNVWEMKMKNIIKMAADRQMFIDQSQSLNLFVAEPTYSKLSSMHFYAWKSGLKTGMYYLRTKPKTSAIKFTVDKEALKSVAEIVQEGSSCTMLDGCLSCSG